MSEPARNPFDPPERRDDESAREPEPLAERPLGSLGDRAPLAPTPDPSPSASPIQSPTPTPSPIPTPLEGVAPMPGASVPPKPAAKPGGPWATLLLFALVIIFAVLERNKVGLGGRPLVDALGLSHEIKDSPAESWRLVSALFVHSTDGAYVLVLFATIWSLFRARFAEKLLGTGAVLFTFVIGGAAANLARVFAEPTSFYENVPGGVAAGLALVTAGVVAARRAGVALFAANDFAYVGYRIAFAFLALVVASGVTTPEQIGTKLPEVAPGVIAGVAIGALLGYALPSGPRRRAGSPIGPVLLVVALGAIVFAIGSIIFREGRQLLDPSTSFKIDPDATLRPLDDEKLGFSVRVPRAMFETARDKNQVTLQTIGGHAIQIISAPRAHDADLLAENFAETIEKKEPSSTIEDGPRAFTGGALKGQIVVLTRDAGGGQVGVRFYVFVGREREFQIYYQHPKDDADAAALGDAIARSLKENAASSDKEPKGRKR